MAPDDGTVSPDVSVAEPPVVPSPPETQPAPPAATQEPDYDSILSTLSPEKKAELAEKHFSDDINRRVDRGITKGRQKLEAEYKERQTQAEARRTQRTQVEQQVNYLKSLPADQRGEWLSSPQNAAWYAQATQYLASNPAQTGFDEKAYTDRIYADFKRALAEDEGFADVDLDGIEPEDSLGKWLAKVAQARTAKEQKAMQEGMKKEIQATIAAELAKIHASATEPDKLPPGGGPSDGLTLDRYTAMSREERAKLSDEEVDRMSRRAMGFER